MEPLIEIIRRRISSRLDKLGLTPITAAQKSLLPRDTIRNIFRADGSIPRADTLVQIASALDTTASYLIGEAPTDELDLHAAHAAAGRQIAVVCDLAFNVWKQPSEHPTDLTIGVDIPGYESSSLFAGRMLDGHANLYYKVGTYIIFAPIAEAGIRPEDHLLIRRERGGKIELTVRGMGIDKKRNPVLYPIAFGSKYQTMKTERFQPPRFGDEFQLYATAIGSFWMRDRDPGSDIGTFYPHTIEDIVTGGLERPSQDQIDEVVRSETDGRSGGDTT